MHKWVKVGKIFNPLEHVVLKGNYEFAKSPQALVFKDRVRIYFSTCPVNILNSKRISEVAYVDMTKDFAKILGVSQEKVIPLGGLGEFDEHGIFPFSVLEHDKKIYAYTSGWSRRVSVSVETGIGLAVSEDGGNTFIKIGKGGPLLSATLNEPFLVVDGYVKVYDRIFHMWYIHGTKWIKNNSTTGPERVYKIAHATSADGIHWQKDGIFNIIPNKIGENECQALPSVIEFQGAYHMFFCYREPFNFRGVGNGTYKIGHASSVDLRSWVRSEGDLLSSGHVGDWDSDMQCYPSVVKVDENIFMLYNGNEFGKSGFGLAMLDLKRL